MVMISRGMDDKSSLNGGKSNLKTVEGNRQQRSTKLH